MPQTALRNPVSSRTRLIGLVRGLPISVVLFTTLLLFNLAQTSSLMLIPFSRHAFRRVNRWIANTWWGLCVTVGERILGVELVVSGEEIPERESAIVVSNHQQMPDITVLMALARSKGRLGDLKWFVKRQLLFVPGIGWGMWFLDCLFVRRSWTRDRASIERTFARLVRDRVPLWLISFVEGTRITESKLQRSNAHAVGKGHAPLKHLLLPRTKGFVASVVGLRGVIDAVYDVTIAYPQGVPTLWQHVRGFTSVVHLHLRRWAIDQLPQQQDELGSWLIQRFQEKDRLLDCFYAHQCFVEDQSTPVAAAGG